MDTSAVKGYSALVGIVLLAVGLLGFVNNPIVGQPNALFVTGAVHNVVHIATGLIALFIAFGLEGRAQVNGVIGFGLLYLVVFVLLLVSPNMFGILDYPVNAADHVLHAGLAVISLAVGYTARNQSLATA
jgi:Domain of unknown function (DUF4383)